jgi:hypothetical protein
VSRVFRPGAAAGAWEGSEEAARWQLERAWDADALAWVAERPESRRVDAEPRRDPVRATLLRPAGGSSLALEIESAGGSGGAVEGAPPRADDYAERTRERSRERWRLRGALVRYGDTLAEAGDEGGAADARRLAERLKACSCGVIWHGGAVESLWLQLCRSKVCPWCAAGVRAERAELLGAVMARRVEVADAAERLYHPTRSPRAARRLLFVTLTLRGRVGRSWGDTEAELTSSWRTVARSRAWARAVEGGYWARETTRKGPSWHVHMHVLVELSPGQTATRFKRWLKGAWVTATGGSHVVDVRPWRWWESSQLALELTNTEVKAQAAVGEVGGFARAAPGARRERLAEYMAKGSGTHTRGGGARLRHPDWLAEWALGESGRRDHAYFGAWAATRREVEPALAIARLCETAAAALPPEPSQVDRATGEVADRADGRVSAWRSADRALRREHTACYELAWFRWSGASAAIQAARAELRRALVLAAQLAIRLEHDGAAVRWRRHAIEVEPAALLDELTRSAGGLAGVLAVGLGDECAALAAQLARHHQGGGGAKLGARAGGAVI